jgi:hypothetical protein
MSAASAPSALPAEPPVRNQACLHTLFTRLAAAIQQSADTMPTRPPKDKTEQAAFNVALSMLTAQSKTLENLLLEVRGEVAAELIPAGGPETMAPQRAAANVARMATEIGKLFAPTEPKDPVLEAAANKAVDVSWDMYKSVRENLKQIKHERA